MTGVHTCALPIYLIKSIKNIEQFSFDYPQEKVFLQFDNSAYYVGETIWFKAFVALSMGNRPTVLSKVLYVELLDQDGDVVDKRKLKIENGMCHGEFSIKEDMRSGYYEVRAYTRVMLNWGDDIIFSRVFPIFKQNKVYGDYSKQTIVPVPKNREKPYNRLKAEKKNNINAVFLPEGGDMIKNLASLVAFKITDKSGKGVDARGYILNQQKDTVAFFQTSHKGMGRFGFVPYEDNYNAYVIYNGKTREFKLPSPKKSGYSVSVNNTRRNKMMIQVSRNDDTVGEILGLSIINGGKNYLVEEVNLINDKEFVISVNKSDLPSGVNQITLFNIHGKPYCERLAFVNNNDFIKASEEPDNVLKPFEQVNIRIKTTDEKGEPFPADFSVSVKDRNSDIKSSFNDNIMTNFLLSSEIKGFIEDIEYYFEDNTPQRSNNLDLLMMTQGWRRYNWEMMASEKDTFITHLDSQFQMAPTVVLRTNAYLTNILQMPGSVLHLHLHLHHLADLSL